MNILVADENLWKWISLFILSALFVGFILSVFVSAGFDRKLASKNAYYLTIIDDMNSKYIAQISVLNSDAAEAQRRSAVIVTDLNAQIMQLCIEKEELYKQNGLFRTEMVHFQDRLVDLIRNPLSELHFRARFREMMNRCAGEVYYHHATSARLIDDRSIAEPIKINRYTLVEYKYQIQFAGLDMVCPEEVAEQISKAVVNKVLFDFAHNSILLKAGLFR
jgi:hypothetical protein